MPVQIKRRVVKRNTVEVSEKGVRSSQRHETKTTLGAKRMSGTKNQDAKSRISLWNVDSENAKAPIARGTIQLTPDVVRELMELVEDGEEIVELGVSIWQSDSENERAPAFTGLIKSPSEREAEKAAAAEAKSGGKKKSATNKRRSL